MSFEPIIINTSTLALGTHGADSTAANAAAENKENVARAIVRRLHLSCWVVVIGGASKDKDGGSSTVIVAIVVVAARAVGTVRAIRCP
jgi:hypothetical protein